ncbi:MAG: primosomal protein N' [Candidatus Brachytrichaceae bacterium NZ_4S206]|jgi:primosomal protein N' (replication factor Y)
MADMSAPQCVASVALLSQAVAEPLSYLVPDHLRSQVSLGLAVVVPLQHRLTSGIVVELGALTQPVEAELKPIHAVLDARPALNPAQLELARWIAAEYHAPLGRCCALMTPPGFTPRSAYVYGLTEAGERAAKLNVADAGPADARARLLRALYLRGTLVESKLARVMRGAPDWRRALKALIAAGLVSRASTLQPPPVRPRRTTLAQLAIGEGTLELVLANLQANNKLKPETRARRAAALNYLQSHNGLASAEWIFAETGATREDLSWLAARGYIMLGDAERWRDPLADVDYVVKSPPPLTEDQERVWRAIEAGVGGQGSGIGDRGSGVRESDSSNSQFSILNSQFLLRGVTGSGKTEIYMRAAEAALKQGSGVLILVPEIALTPQTARRFLERFPGQVALIHSGLKPGERYDTWRRIRAGELRVVVGARSALFAPLAEVGLIVLDEEHDPSYKQNNPPYYDARRVAMRYAELTGATLIFGSATPSLEAWQRVDAGHLTLLELPNRVRGHVRRITDQQMRLGVQAAVQLETEAVAYQPLPAVQVVDMRAELRGGNTDMFSGALALALGETLRRGEQAILFLNRRGAASSVLCRDCGHVLRCPNDDTPLTYHSDVGSREWNVTAAHTRLLSPHLRCHQCDHTEPVPSRCPACGSGRIRFIGLGTQKVEQAVRQRFPEARVLRWDRDSAGRGGGDHILQRFVNRQADVLIGTQMIAKGLDLPMVTLVGVVLADVGLFLPDFRAGERVFDLLLQVAGRAGRGLLPGRVIVQTYNPEHPAIAFAARHDVQGFVAYELAQRRALNLPPFVRLVRFEYADADNDAARRACELLARDVRRSPHQVGVIGPAQAYFTRRNNRYRWQILVRTHTPRALLTDLNVPRAVVVDVDPVSVL